MPQRKLKTVTPPMEQNDRGAYCPTAEEIAAAAAEIRANWTEAEHRVRMGMPREIQEWKPPSYDMGWLI